MAYTDLLDDEGINSQFLIVLKPARRVPTWTLDSGTTFVADFDFGTTIDVQVDGVALTLGSGITTLADNEWFWDFTGQKLYAQLTGGGSPAAVFTIAIYEIYVATFDAFLPRDPTATETTSNRVVYWEPVVQKSPQFKATISNSLFGFLPVQTSGVNLINAEHIFERHIDDNTSSSSGSSFNRIN